MSAKREGFELGQLFKKFALVNIVVVLVLPILIAMLWSTPVHADISAGLTAYYSFDDISGATAPDSSGNGYNGTITGSASTVSGAVGDALSFDGSDDTVDIPHQLVPSETPDFSYSFYFKADAGGDDTQYLLAQASSGTNNNDCFSVAYDNSAQSLKVLTTNNGNNAKITSDVDASSWTHIVVTNSYSTNESKLYINGVPQTGTAMSCAQDLDAQFLLGRSPWAGYNQQLKGSLDEVRVYSRILSDQDIHALATEGNTNTISISTPLNGATVGGAVSLESTATGSPSVSSVQYYANGEEVGSSVSPSPFAQTWDTTAIDQGDYQLVAVGTDSNGDKISSEVVNVEVDNAPLARMQNVRSRSQTSATVFWVTDEPTTTQLSYGTTDSYGNQTTLDPALSYYHSQTLSGLNPGTTYHYQIDSTDNNDNRVAPDDNTFSTLTDAPGNEWHVSTTGSVSGDGSIDSPWDLASTLAHQPASVQPGDTIWVHGGTYSGYFYSTLTGSQEAPIIVRNFEDERVIIDGGTGADPGHFVGQSAFYVGGSDTWYWGLEIMSSSNTRTVTEAGSAPTDLERAYGFYIEGPRTRFINNIVHDTAQGFGFWSPAVDAELYGNIDYYNGWEGPDRGHGHGIYVQNNTGFKYIANNIVFKNYGWGLHAYTQSGYINNIMTNGNTFFESGVLSSAGRTLNMLHGGYRVAENPMIFNNTTYMPQSSGAALGLGYVEGCNYATVANNYFVGQSAADVSNSCPHTMISGNLFYGTVPGGLSTDQPDNTFTVSAPENNVSTVRQNEYEPDKGTVTIYNWEDLDNVSIDASEVLVEGDTYEIIDTQNYFGDPIATGTYNGTSLTVPMTTTEVAELIGDDAPVQPEHTGKEFGSFILVKTGHVVSEPTPEDDTDEGTDAGESDSNEANSAGSQKTNQVTANDISQTIFSGNIDVATQESQKSEEDNDSQKNENNVSRLNNNSQTTPSNTKKKPNNSHYVPVIFIGVIILSFFAIFIKKFIGA